MAIAARSTQSAMMMTAGLRWRLAVAGRHHGLANFAGHGDRRPGVAARKSDASARRKDKGQRLQEKQSSDPARHERARRSPQTGPQFHHEGRVGNKRRLSRATCRRRSAASLKFPRLSPERHILGRAARMETIIAGFGIVEAPPAGTRPLSGARYRFPIETSRRCRRFCLMRPSPSRSIPARARIRDGSTSPRRRRADAPGRQ